MAVSQIHFRSISLPSRLHPINSNGFEGDLEKLKSLHISSHLLKTAPITSEAIKSALLTLANLYNSIEQFTQSPSLHHQDEKSIQESLSGSVELLDSCNTIKELGQMMRENLQTLQSALRRKGLDSSIQSDIASYFSFRKKMNKCIAKSFKTLKNLESKNIGSSSNLSTGGTGDHESNFIAALKEASSLTIAIFKCTLVFFSSSIIKSSGWNLVSRLMLAKSVASTKDNNGISEVGCVDFALSNLLRNDDSKVVDKQMVQSSLQNLESCMQEIEAGLDTLFRRLLQSRVNLLNIVVDL